MSLRFICPHCHVAVDPVAMEAAHNEGADFRVCPCCDAPVVLSVRDDREANPLNLCANSLQPMFEVGTCSVGQGDFQTAAA